MEQLDEGAEAQGKVVLAHLGNGASLAAVRDGKSVARAWALFAGGIGENLPAVRARICRGDEELMIARSVHRVLGVGMAGEDLGRKTAGASREGK